MRIYFVFKVSLIFLGFLFLFSCENDKREPICIDIKNASKDKIKLSSIFSSLEYIQLETNDKCLLTDESSFYLTDKWIVAVDLKSNKSYLFDRKGRFIKQIGKCGNGPGEYYLCTRLLSKSDNILYFNNFTRWLGVNIENDSVSYLIKPDLKQIKDTSNTLINEHFNTYLYPVHSFIKCDELSYWGFVSNISGKVGIQLVKFDQKGTIESCIENTLFYEPRKDMVRPLGAIFEIFNDSILYKDVSRDTIFALVNNNLKPKYVLNLEELSRPYNWLSDLHFSVGRYFVMGSFFEFSDFSFFCYGYHFQNHWGYYHKKDGLVYLSENEIVNDVKTNFPIGSLFDKFNNQLLFCVSSDLMLDSFFQKQSDDNPVLVIATIKE